MMICIFFSCFQQVFAGGCGNPESPQNPYYIAFTYDNQRYFYTLGLTDIQEHCYGEKATSAIYMFAIDRVADSSSLSGNYIMINLFSGTPGEPIVPGVFDDSIEVHVLVSIDETLYESTWNGPTQCTVDSIGEIGGIIEGTFFAEVRDVMTMTEIIELTNGEFAVLCIDETGEVE
jgi:hypothetical protein